MESGRQRLIGTALLLLKRHPDREPTTRELYEAAGVAAPTLYHHFGTKEGLLEAVVEEAFAEYLQRKQGMLRTGDLLADFAAGWDLHVEFGVENPVLYGLMYGGGRTDAAASADQELRRGLQRLADAGVLRISVDEAAALTTAMAIGCVTQLKREGLPPDSTLARGMRASLISEIAGQPIRPDQAARSVLAQLGSEPDLFTPAEKALLQQWLQVFATHAERSQAVPGPIYPPSKGRDHD